MMFYPTQKKEYPIVMVIAIAIAKDMAMIMIIIILSTYHGVVLILSRAFFLDFF